MTYKYVDLSLASGGDGSSGNPWGLSNFFSELQPGGGFSDDTTFRLKGSGTLTTTNASAQLKITNNYGHSIVIESWEDTPAKLVLETLITNGASHNIVNIPLAGPGCGCYGITLKRFLIESKVTVSSGSINVFTLSDIGENGGHYTTTYENMCIVANLDTTPTWAHSGIFGGEHWDISIKGCTVANVGVGVIPNVCCPAPGTTVVTIDSICVEGKFKYLFYFDPAAGSLSANYDYMALYNDSEYLGVYDTGSQETATPGAHNLLNAGSGSQIKNITDILSMSLPDDL